MNLTARLLAPLVVFFCSTGCRHVAANPAAPPAVREAIDAAPLQASSNKLVGRVISIDSGRRFAIVALASDPPAAALADGAELVSRTDELRETGRLQTSRYVRGRVLGTNIVAGQPTPGDEVVFHLP